MSEDQQRRKLHQPPCPQPPQELAQLLELALTFHRQGRLSQAEPLYNAMLERAPRDFDALHLLGVIRSQQRNFTAAAALIGQALSINPGSAPAHANMGNALRALKRHAEALSSYERALEIQPEYAEALNGRGNALFEMRRHQEALANYDRALTMKPGNPEFLNNRGNALLALERHQEALASYDAALAVKPVDATVFYNRGNALLGLQRHQDALASYERALAIRPDYVDALNNRGNLLRQCHHYRQALASFEQALALRPGDPEALNNRGNALLDLERPAEALASYDDALAIRPSYADALNNRGNALRQLRRDEEALASYVRALEVRPDDAEILNNRGNALLALRRHEEALASYDRALAIKPSDAAVFYNRGNALLDLQRPEAALANYDRALALKPDYAEALNNRGNALLNLNCHEQAAEAFAKLRAMKADYDYAGGNILSSRLRGCDWQDYDNDVAAVVNDVLAGRRAATPFFFLSISDAPAAQLQCAKIYGGDKYAAGSEIIWRGETYRHDKIRVAYLSGEFHSHATVHLMAGLFEMHDRSRFEITAISYGPNSEDKVRQTLEASFDRFFDVRSESDRDAALLLRDLEIDIAVDLVGFRSHCRTGILSFRPAPVQVNYKGYPGTMGLDYIDYILADRIVIPADQQSFYSEKVVYLPDSYQPNDAKRPISERTPTRREASLPAAGFVFCSFNNDYKIAPHVFDIWMRLLDRVAGSVLWLLADDPAVMPRLRQRAAERGIPPDRLVLAPRVKLDDHLARHRLADLFLDTLPYNAHATASDALWAGLPVVTCSGSSFASRVAASLLSAVGLPELITYNLEDYEELAVKLALAPPLLAATKAKLAQNRATFPLFDADRTCRHIESAYQTMWKRHQRGEAPTSFAVAPYRAGRDAER